jgi:hypothetical protein
VKQLPHVHRYSAVTPEDRASAIEFVNRVNWLFEVWDVDAMVDAFLPDSVTYHFHGTSRGQDEATRFFDDLYPYIIPGVSRHATNHIVDLDEDGVVVRYHNLLIRHAPPEAAPALVAGQAMEVLTIFPLSGCTHQWSTACVARIADGGSLSAMLAIRRSISA